MTTYCDAPLPDTHNRCRRRVTHDGKRCHLHPRIPFTSLTGNTQQHPYLNTTFRARLAPGSQVALENVADGRVQLSLSGPLAVELAQAIRDAYTKREDV